MSVEKASASQMRVANVHYCVFESALADLIVNAGGADALGMWVYLINKPSGWKIVPKDIQTRCGLGRDRYTRAVAVLKQLRVLRQVRLHIDGKMAGSELVVSNAILAEDSPVLQTSDPSLQESVGSLDSTSLQVSGGSGNHEARENPSTRENNPLSYLLSNKQTIKKTQAASPLAVDNFDFVLDDDSLISDLPQPADGVQCNDHVKQFVPDELQHNWPFSLAAWPEWLPVLAFAHWADTCGRRGNRLQAQQVPVTLRMLQGGAVHAETSPQQYINFHLFKGWRSFHQVEPDDMQKFNQQQGAVHAADNEGHSDTPDREFGDYSGV